MYIKRLSFSGVEIVGPSYRYLMGLLGPIMWTVGAITSTGIAYFIRERITLQFVLSIPLLFFIGYILYVFHFFFECHKNVTVHGQFKLTLV